MATAYYRPGVYIEEVDKGAKPIQGVATSVAVFAGFTQKAEKFEDDGITTRSILGEPTLVTDWGQYVRQFGSYHPDAYLPLSVRGFFDNGGGRCYIISVKAMNSHRAQTLITGTDDKTEKALPVLMVRAKQGGIAGNNIRIAISDTVMSGNPKEREKIAHKFNVNVYANGSSSAPNSTGNPAVKSAQDKLDAASKKVQDLEQSIKSVKDEWAAKKVDLDATGPQWTKAKNDYKGNDQEQLDKIQSDYQQSKKALETAKGEEGAAQKALNEAQSSAGGTGDNGGNSEGDKPAETLNLSLGDLPFWGENTNPKIQKIAETQGQYVEVWRLHKSGREAAILPDVKEREDPYTLGNGAFSFDHDYLIQNELMTEAEQNDLATKEDEIFADKSSLLYQGSEPARKGIDGLHAYDDINLICMPDLMKVYDMVDDKATAENMIKDVQEKVLTFCQNAHYPFAILDAPKGKNAQEIADWRMNDAGFDSMYGALYYPWIKVTDPFDAKRQIEIPPCGHVAGVYARSDSQRGVHKAPANETVNNAVDLARNVTNGEQEMLNPIGINCIRKFPGRGIRIWGARTLAMTDPSWRYINVRRLFSYVEASVERSTQWAVFEPNDFALWAKIRRDVTAFLRTVWLSGALFGQSPEQAFYVKCNEETNPSELRDLGQMICEIGMSPVKPAEFVIFRFSQWTDQAEV